VRVVTLTNVVSLHGGAEHLALTIATRLDPARFDSRLCSSRWIAPGIDPSSEQAMRMLAEGGVPVLKLGRKGKLDIWVWLRLLHYLRKQRIDVLHAHKFGSNAWGALIGRLARVPVVLAHEHSWSYTGKPLRRFVDRRLIARWSSRFIAVSREDQRRMSAVEGIAPSRTLFLPNAVLASTPTSGRDIRAELGIPATAPLVGAVGLLRPEKAYQVLVRAAAQLRASQPEVQILIVGDGPERAALQRLAEELGVMDTVRFVGRRTDVPDILSVLDIAVCCSDSEGSPLSVMEYMQAGLPVVATRVGGIPDLIEPDVHGLLVPRGDSTALASALAELLAAPERARAMGTRAAERQRAEFDIDVLVRRIEGIYLDLLAGRAPEDFTKASPTAHSADIPR
jgi:glycosyltransferase involved in cell wall biosynthesis